MKFSVRDNSQIELIINEIRVAQDTECFFIAEIGHNHQGCVEKCKSLFFEAKNAGASAVKLQKRDIKNLYTSQYYNEPYSSINAYGATYGTHRDALEFNAEEYKELQHYAKEIGIIFFATAFDPKSADLLAALDMPAFKIASGDVTNHFLLKHIAAFNKPMILSTGGATLLDVEEAVNVIQKYHNQIALLQCTAVYPPKDEELNLSVIQTFKNSFPYVVGYSGHDLGSSMSLASYTLGARIIEKHFTLDKNLPGSDHKLSLNPEELTYLINELKRLHLALGTGRKIIFESELTAIKKMSKKIVASDDIPSGSILEPQHLLFKSPGDGIPPSKVSLVIGKKIKISIRKDEPVLLENLI